MSPKDRDIPTSAAAESSSRTGRSKFQRDSIVDSELLSSLAHKLGHEIGNPLTSIISLGSILDRFSGIPDSPLDDEKTVSYARSIVKEAWRINALTEKMVLLLSSKDGSQQSNDLLTLIHSSLSKLRTRQNFDSDWIRLRIDDESVSAFCDADQTLILVSECLSNAYQAVGAFEAEEAPESPPITLRLSQETPFAVIEVITQQKFACPFELSELFELFTTSWADDKHLGIGLSMAAGIVERAGGSIEIEERAGENGFDFVTRIRLKTDAKAVDEIADVIPSATTEQAPLFSKAATILIIDDEPTVASAISKIIELSARNKETLTIECLSGEDALERLKNDAEVSVILCDLNLEGMSGRHILETIQNTRPELVSRFAFITGDASRGDTELYLRSSGRPFLSKPFEPEALISLVKQLSA